MKPSFCFIYFSHLVVMKFEHTMFLMPSLVIWKMKTVAPCLTHELTHLLNRWEPGGSVLGLGYNTEQTDVLSLIECMPCGSQLRVHQVDIRALLKALGKHNGHSCSK